MNEFFIIHSKEAAKQLNVEELNGKKRKARGKARTYPCSYGCGEAFTKKAVKDHEMKCRFKSELERVENEYSGHHEYQGSYPLSTH